MSPSFRQKTSIDAPERERVGPTSSPAGNRPAATQLKTYVWPRRARARLLGSNVEIIRAFARFTGNSRGVEIAQHDGDMLPASLLPPDHQAGNCPQGWQVDPALSVPE